MPEVPEVSDQEFWEERSRRFWAENPMSGALEKNAFYPWNLSSKGMTWGSKLWKSSAGFWAAPEHQAMFLHPWEPSPCRTGLAVWDRSILVPRSSGSVLPAGQAVGHVINFDWHQTLMDLNDVTPGLKGKRPDGQHVWDLLKFPDSWELVNLAHSLAHKLVHVERQRFRYCQTSQILAGCLFKIMLAIKYDLVMDMEPGKDRTGTLDSLEKRGIRIHMSRQFRNPRMDIPCIGPNSLRQDYDTCVILAAMHFEPQPNQRIMDESRWLEVNRWSCLPTIACFSGWQTVDVITHSQLVRYRNGKDLFWELPVHAMESSGKFHLLLNEKDEGDNRRFFKVWDYLDSPEWKKDKACSRTLPCRSCMQVNSRIENSPVKPVGEMDEKNKDWLKYEEGMETIYSTCEKAIQFYEGHIDSHTAAKKERRSRNSLSAKVDRLTERAKTISVRAKRKRAEGFLSEAKLLFQKRDELLKEIEEEKSKVVESKKEKEKKP